MKPSMRTPDESGDGDARLTEREIPVALADFAKVKIRLVLAVSAFVLAAAAQWGGGDLYERLDATLVDRLAELKGMPTEGVSAGDALSGASDPIVYIDANFYYDRSHHARIIDNLAAVKIRSQIVDFVFEEHLGDENDRRMTAAVRAARRVYLGMVFGSLEPPVNGVWGSARGDAADPEDWAASVVSSSDDVFVGRHPRMTASHLAKAAAGIGFLNLPADADGILRGLPLFVRHRGAFYPSLSLLAACDYLGVLPADIEVDPEKQIILKGAKTAPGAPGRDIVIPVDRRGRMLVNFNDIPTRTAHYSYREIFRAAEDPGVRARLERDLAGKIAVIAENVAAEVKVRPAGGQKRLTTGAVHAAVIRNILSETFLRTLSPGVGIGAAAVLAIGIFGLSLICSSTGLILGTLVLSGLYLGTGAIAFTMFLTLLPFSAPLFTAGLTCVFILAAIAAERAMHFARTEQARHRAEHELDIGRRIQAGFFPTILPEVGGWEIAAHFHAARHVSGDFYDAFCFEDPRYMGVVIADVCDKGVGAALYMAIFRSLVRILSRASGVDCGAARGPENFDPSRVLAKTIRSVNEYIAVTHEKDAMFATLFFGILDTETGELFYINGGHEPPLIVSGLGIKARLAPTGAAVGAFREASFTVLRVRIGPGETLLAYTDGVTEACNPAGRLFTRERLVRRAGAFCAAPHHLIDEIRMEIESFTSADGLRDDVTLLALGRQPSASAD
ncbi:SpoIIE family protein phosphatase [Desulfococcus sp.]|uniref:SpoIIE family protein phosphatase n=1 Tax=Desulfococcus sp. TaxID=2025834 RepID=UPI003D0A7CE0